MITQRATVLVLSMMTVVVTLLPTSTTSFLLSPPPSSWSSLQMATQPATADFEYQELKIQLSAMKEQDVVTSRLASSKRNELEGYVKRILNRRTVASSKSIPLYEIGDFLPNTKWRLIFSTQSLTSELPKDAKIQLEFVDNGKLDYILEFSKTLGLKRLVAKSSYTVDVSNCKAT